MLPPDTSSNLLPWRVMVLLMQVCSGFPYMMSSTSSAPVFSLPLCLWEVVMQLLLVTGYCVNFDRQYSQYLSSDVGTVTHVYSFIIMIVFMCLVPIVMAMKSEMLAALLHDMSQIKGVSPPPTYRWYYKTKNLALLLLLVSLTSFSLWLNCTRMGNTTFMEVVFFTPMCVFCILNFLLPEELSSMVFDLLARRLLVATEAVVRTIFPLLAPDGSFKCDNNVKEAMVALRDLDAVIREVEVQREKGTRYFFPVITMFLVMSVLLAITSPYAIKQGSFMGGATLISLFIAYYIMARLCHLGQAFVNQVSAAEGLLKDLRVKSQNLSFSLKVSQVIGSLTPLLTFNMCGCYTLSYSSFLGLININLTYLVIIFQVGGITGTETLPSPINAKSSVEMQ